MRTNQGRQTTTWCDRVRQKRSLAVGRLLQYVASSCGRIFLCWLCRQQGYAAERRWQYIFPSGRVSTALRPPERFRQRRLASVNNGRGKCDDTWETHIMSSQKSFHHRARARRRPCSGEAGQSAKETSTMNWWLPRAGRPNGRKYRLRSALAEPSKNPNSFLN